MDLLNSCFGFIEAIGQNFLTLNACNNTFFINMDVKNNIELKSVFIRTVYGMTCLLF